MNQKKIPIALLGIFAIVLIVYIVLIKNRTFIPSAQKIVFVSQEECEQSTGKPCTFQMCDYVPAGKTFEEVCGKDFKKGWVPIPPTSNSLPLSASTQSTTQNPSTEKKILEITLEVNAPFSTAKLTIYKDCSASYLEKQYGQPEKLTGYEEAIIEICASQMNKFNDLVRENNFLSLKNNPRRSSDPVDGSAYTITVKLLSTGSTELIDAMVHTVSCYQYSCEQKFLEIRNEIRAFFKLYYGKEILEVGV